MPLVMVLMIAQVPKWLEWLTPLGVWLGSVHGKDEVYMDDVLVDRIGGLSNVWRKGDPAWWIRVAEDRASCCCFGGGGFGVREDRVAEARASCCRFGGGGFGVRDDFLGAACTYRAADTNEKGQDNMQHADRHNCFVFMYIRRASLQTLQYESIH
jgi:hypothetical protein